MRKVSPAAAPLAECDIRGYVDGILVSLSASKRQYVTTRILALIEYLSTMQVK